jgi:addiction module RelB/DinJ family antitoxin
LLPLEDESLRGSDDMNTQSANAQQTRINIRVNGDLKREAEDIFGKIGLNLSDGINIYLRKVVADKGIPFPLTISRSQEIGAEAAAREDSFRHTVTERIGELQAKGVPIARYDVELQRPYLEYPDGRKEYTLED